MKLIWKILLPVILLIMLLVGVSGYMAYTKSSAALRQAVLDNMKDDAESLQLMTSYVLGVSMQHVERASADAMVRDFFTGDIQNKDAQLKLSSYLAHLLKTASGIDRINVFDAGGSIVASSNSKVIGSNFKERPYFVEAMKGKNFVSAPFRSDITKQGMLIVSVPLRMSNEVVGVVNGTIPLPEYYDTTMKHVTVGARGYAYAMDSKGFIVAHKNADRLFREDLPGSHSYKEMAASPDGTMFFVNADGLPSVAYHIKEPFSGMTLVVQANENDVFTVLDDLAKTTLIIIVAAILLGSFLVLFIIRPIVRALNRSVAFASEVAGGNLHSTLEVRRKDEIGTLADALRSIPESLKSILAEYRGLEEDLIAGKIEIQGDVSKFPGDFASLIAGTNAMLGRYQMILNSFTSPVLLLDKEQRVIYLNAAAKAIAGSDCYGKTCREVMAPEDYGAPTYAVRHAVESMLPASAETVAHPSGVRMDISYTAIPFVDKNGKLATVLQLITDLTRVKNTQRVILEVATQAGEISKRMTAASGALSTQVSQVSSGAEVQRERASSTAAAMEEMNSTVLEVARNAGSASKQADATSKKATEGAELVNQACSAISEVLAVANRLDASMRDLGDQAKSIGSVMSVISDIADQTNLLALNAAIEAARAGDAGRGFAVVADEVRKLAEKTIQATQEVGSNIKCIQTAVLANMTQVTEAGEGVKKATEVAAVSGNALAEILVLTDANSSLITGIATAAEEQSTTSEEINRAVEDMNRIAEETAMGMRESSDAVHELSRMAQELNHLLERLRNQ